MPLLETTTAPRKPMPRAGGAGAIGPNPAPEPATPTPDAARAALDRAVRCLQSMQAPQGYWCAELQGDSILESEYILLKFILGQESDPDLPAITSYLRSLQGPDGGWPLFPGGKADLSGTVKAYFCLKLMGDDPAAPHMAAARNLILRLGGAERCNTFTRFYFACLGQIGHGRDAGPRRRSERLVRGDARP